jgi:hypothetical protein
MISVYNIILWFHQTDRGGFVAGNLGYHPTTDQLLRSENVNAGHLFGMGFLRLGQLIAGGKSPIQKRGIRIDEGNQARVKSIPMIEFENGKSGIYDVLKCPVCGCKSSVQIFDIKNENPDPEDHGKTSKLINRPSGFYSIDILV